MQYIIAPNNRLSSYCMRRKVGGESVLYSDNEFICTAYVLNPYEKEIDGVFGGVLRMLEALWDFLVDLASRIADAVGRAVSFFIDMISGLVSAMFNALIEPIVGMKESYMQNLMKVVDSAFDEMLERGEVSSTTLALIDEALCGELYWLLLALAIGAIIALAIATPFIAAFTPLICVLVAVILPIILMGLLSQPSPSRRDYEIPPPPSLISPLGVVDMAGDFEDKYRGGQDEHQLYWQLLVALFSLKSAKWSLVVYAGWFEPTGAAWSIAGIVASVLGALMGISSGAVHLYGWASLALLVSLLGVLCGLLGLLKSASKMVIPTIILASFAIGIGIVGLFFGLYAFRSS